MRLLLSADRGRYGKLVDKLKNEYAKGQEMYLKTIFKAYNLLVSYKVTGISWNTGKGHKNKVVEDYVDFGIVAP